MVYLAIIASFECNNEISGDLAKHYSISVSKVC